MVIHAGDKEKDPMMSSTLTLAATKTLQRSPAFHSLFHQLGLTPEARTAATEAIVRIASSSKSHCFTTEAHAMINEVQYPDHKMPLYVSTMINEVHVRKAFVDTGSSLNVIPLSTLVTASISRRKIQGLPMEITRFGGGCEHTIGHIQLVLKVGPLMGLSRFHVLDSSMSYHVLLGRSLLHKYKLISSTYLQYVKGSLNRKPICILANPTPFNQSEAHYLEAAFYDQLTISREDAITKPLGTPLPSWEDIKGGSEVDLRDLLERKKKRKERKETTHDSPRCEKIQLPDGRIDYRL